MGWFVFLCLQSCVAAVALAGCSGTTTLLSTSLTLQNITSPGYPNFYTGTNPCMWSVSRGQNDVIHLTVTEFDTLSGDKCTDTLDIITALPGGIRTSIGTWCGRTYGQTVEVAADVFIDFRPAVGSRSRLHVQIKHIDRKQLCNNSNVIQLTATDIPIYLYSPLYPQVPEGWEFDCRWTISPSTPGDTIYLEAVHFEMSISDYLHSSRNSLNVVSGSVNKTVLDNKRFAIVGDVSRMELTLKVDTRKDWIGVPQSIPGMALRYYTSRLGLPTQPSPGSIMELTAYPQPQFIEMRGSEFSTGIYTWKVTANSTDKAVVMETIYWRFVDCNPNIRVYDGINTSVTPVYTYCSDDSDSLAPQIFRSSSHVMVMTSQVASSTISGQTRGFTIKYYTRDKYDFDMGTVMAEESPAFVYLHVQHNNGMFPGQGFKVTSEDFLDKCVKLELVNTAFQPITDVHFAQVIRVFDGGNSSADELGTCTNVLSPSVTSSGIYMYVEVRQGAVSTVDGLWIKFYVVDECPANDIQLTSPSSLTELPHEYNIFSDIKPVTCRWRIPSGNGRIKLDTVILDLGYHDNNDQCHDGRIRVYDGHGGHRREITTWCTSSEPPVVSRENKDITVVYRSSTVGRDNYTITYKMVKNEDLEGFGGRLPYATSSVSYLRSPNYPGVYPNAPSTVWRLSTQQHYGKIELVVMVMDTEGSYGNCDGFDVLRIFDGRGKSDTSLKDTLCGSEMDGHRVLSSGRDLLMEFQSNSAIARSGFVIAYTAVKENVTSVCGTELLVDETMAVTTIPASSVRSNKSCVLTLRVTPFFSIISLEFIFHGQSMKNCPPEYLRVRNGRSLQSPLHDQRDCESRFKVESLGQDLHVEILPNPMAGIELRYYSLLENQNCLPGWVRDMTSNETLQTFSVSQISVRYTSMTECKWRLRSVTESHILSVNLTSETGVCTEVQVFDGFDDQSELLASWDGHKPALLHSSGMFIYITTEVTDCMESFYVDFQSVVKPITSTPIPASSSTACNNHVTDVTTDKPEPVTTTARKPEPSPSQTSCTCPSLQPCQQDRVECTNAIGDSHGQSALIIGGCLAGFSLLSLLVISTLLIIRHNKVKERYMVSHRTANRPRAPARNTAFDEPYPEVFDPNDPRLDEEGDLGLGTSRRLSARFSRSHSNPSYELSMEKDVMLNTAL